MKIIFLVLVTIILSSCSNTGVVKMEQNKYMVSVKSAKVGFVSAAEERAEAYKLANEFCSKQDKGVETLNVESRDSGAFQSASATLEFKCVDLMQPL